MPIITQGLAIPPGLANGQIADATQITPLYNSLNAFNFPDGFVVFQDLLADNTTTALATGGPTTKDWAIGSTSTIHAFFFILPYTFANNTNNDMQFTFRANAQAFAGPLSLPNVASSQGLIWIFVGPRNNNFTPYPIFGAKTDISGPVSLFAGSGAGVPNAALTTVGISLSGTAGNASFSGVRVWSEF